MAWALKRLAKDAPITGVDWKDRLLQGAVERARARRRKRRQAEVVITRWRLEDQSWLGIAVDLAPRGHRKNLTLCPVLYDYQSVAKGTLVVDFVARHVGVGCSTWDGSALSEQLDAQSGEYAVCLTDGAYELGDDDAFTFQGVTIDQCLPRGAAAGEGWVRQEDVVGCCSKPLTVIAVNAPNMVGVWAYDENNAQSLQSLAKKRYWSSTLQMC